MKRTSERGRTEDDKLEANRGELSLKSKINRTVVFRPLFVRLIV